MKALDLIRKYGWEAMPFLSGLGATVLADVNIYFVNSQATNTDDIVDGEHGDSFDKPFETANFAVSRCSEGVGDIILLAPEHTETIDDLGTDGTSGDETDELVLDKAGVVLLGIGTGVRRPTFTIGSADASASIAITAANVTVKNIIVQSGMADAAAGFTIAAVTGVTIEDCEISDGNTSGTELVLGISAAANADDITIKNNRFLTAAGGDCANAIKFLGGCDRGLVEGNVAFGKWTAGVMLASAAQSLGIIIKDNVFVNAEGAIALALKTDCTGIISGNYLAGYNSNVAAVMTGDNAMWCFENYLLDEVAASGILDPGAVTS